MVLRLRTLAALAVVTALVGAFMAVSSAPAVAQETAAVAVGDLFFCDESFQNGVCETTIAVGDTVDWSFGGAALPHTTSACAPRARCVPSGRLWSITSVSKATASRNCTCDSTRCGASSVSSAGRSMWTIRRNGR